MTRFGASFVVVILLSILVTVVATADSAGNGTTGPAPDRPSSTPNGEVHPPARGVDKERALADRVKALVDPSGPSTLRLSDDSLELEIPAGVHSKALEFSIEPRRAPGGSGVRVFQQWDLRAADISADKEIDRFSREITLKSVFRREDVRGLDWNSLSFVWFNPKTNTWDLIPTVIDFESRTMTAKTDHFSIYGTQGASAYAVPGQIMSHQVNLNSGASSYTYPIELPPGRGGFQPLSLAFNYNSGSVDEMKNKRDIGSMAGVGWSFDLPHLLHNEETRRYSLVLGGVSSGLETDVNRYWTNPDTGLLLDDPNDSSGKYWVVTDQDGTAYEFKNRRTRYETPCSDEFIYRWDLTKVVDVHGNTFEVTWQNDTQDEGGCSNTRASYPLLIKAMDGSTVLWQVDFDYEDPATSPNFVDSEYSGSVSRIRKDVPGDRPGYPEPIVAETQVLDLISVEDGSGNVIRQYDLTTNTTAADGSGTPFDIAGDHTLVSITMKGKDGGSLPATTFEYQSRELYFNIIADSVVVGNPGNPVSIYRPFLESIENGHGAKVSFTYEQRPDNEAVNRWSRQIVTKVVADPDDGSVVDGTPIVTTYEYLDASGNTTDPVYVAADWNGSDFLFHSVYHGYPLVKVTAADGSYSLVRFFANPGAIWVTHPIDGPVARDGTRFSGKEYERVQYTADGTRLVRTFTDRTWEVQYQDPDRLIYRVLVTGSGTQRYDSTGASEVNKTWTYFTYDDYGNLEVERKLGDYGTPSDDVTIHTDYNLNSSPSVYIVNRPKNRRIYTGDKPADPGSSQTDLISETRFTYDNSSYENAPTKGDLTGVDSYTGSGQFVTTLNSYDSFGNIVSTTSPEGVIANPDYKTEFAYDSTLNALVTQTTLPAVDGAPAMTTSTSYTTGMDVLRGLKSSDTDENGNQTEYVYDEFGRALKVIRPGDSLFKPTLRFSYEAWGTAGEQHVKSEAKVSSEPANYAARKEFFDGFGRVLQAHEVASNGIDTLVSGTVKYDSNGRAINTYSPWVVTGSTSSYKSPFAGVSSADTTKSATAGASSSAGANAWSSVDSLDASDEARAVNVGPGLTAANTGWSRGTEIWNNPYVHQPPHNQPWFTYKGGLVAGDERSAWANVPEVVSGLINESDWLMLKFEDVDVPADATITGYEGRWVHLQANTGVSMNQSRASFFDGVDNQVGNEKVVNGSLTTSWTTGTAGGANDLWGTNFTASDFTNGTARLGYEADNVDYDPGDNALVRIDSAELKIHYDEPTRSDYLEATGFQFNVPVGSRIDGIEVLIERSSETGSHVVRDHTVSLLSQGTSIGENKADLGLDWPTTDTVKEYPATGAATDTWGRNWTAEEINSPDFGVLLQVRTESLDDVRVDHVQIKVFYTAPTAGVLAGSARHDALGRIVEQVGLDGSSVTHSYAAAITAGGAWVETVTDPLGGIARNHTDAFGRLTRVSEFEPGTAAGSTIQFAETLISEAPGHEQFGFDLDYDGTSLIVGAPFEASGAKSKAGLAYIYTHDGTSWVEDATLDPADSLSSEHFGTSVAIDGDHAVLSSRHHNSKGAVYASQRVAGVWSAPVEIATPAGIDNSAYFGSSLALDGETLAVGASRENGYEGSVDVYEWNGGTSTWDHRQMLTASNAAQGDGFGFAVAIDGDTLVVGTDQGDCNGVNNSGAAYVFTRTAGTWTERTMLCPDDAGALADGFGNKVAIDNGSIAVGASAHDAGASNAGATYVFVGSDANWTQQAKLREPVPTENNGFGHEVDLHDGLMAVFARSGDTAASDAGTVYLYKRIGTTWLLGDVLDDGANAGFNHAFGYSTRLHDDELVVGAPYTAAGGTVFSFDISHLLSSYRDTLYTYDAAGNLTRVDVDPREAGLETVTTTMTYDWLGRKETHNDPDVGNWVYEYDANGNMIKQTDARGVEITFAYDELNRETKRECTNGCVGGSSPVLIAQFGYDDTTDGNHGKGRRTSADNGDGSVLDRFFYDSRGRPTRLIRDLQGSYYTTSFTYDPADRLLTTTLPNNEVLAQTYNVRGLPETLSSTVIGEVVGASNYNVLDLPTQIDFGNGTSNVRSYFGIEHNSGTMANFGQLYQIQSTDGAIPFVDLTFDWDLNGNLTSRADQITAAGPATETFTYDFLNRLTGVANAYNRGYIYDGHDNIVARTDVGEFEYSDSTRPHLVTSTTDNSAKYLEQTIYASNASADDLAGYAVATDGETLVLGSRLGGSPSGSGSVHIFERAGSEWVEVQMLTAPTPTMDNSFGAYGLDVDGDTLIVGEHLGEGQANNSGAAYVYTKVAGVWTLQQKLTANDGVTDDIFGFEVAIQGDEAFVGAHYDDDHGEKSGAVYVFTRSNGAWTQADKLTASDAESSDRFGSSFAVDGTNLAIGAEMGDSASANDTGAVYMFARSGGSWSEHRKITASDGVAGDFFFQVALQGDVLAVANAYDDHAGESNRGAVYVYYWDGSEWTDEEIIRNSMTGANDLFGFRIAIDGQLLAIGARDDEGSSDASGAVYVYKFDGSDWNHHARLTSTHHAPGDFLGISVGISGTVVVSGIGKDDTKGSDAGAAAVFDVFDDVVAPGTYTYDANGNTTSRPGQILDWNDENLLGVVKDSGNNLIESYIYDADGQRAVKTAADGTATHYVSGEYQVEDPAGADESVTVSYFHGGQLVATQEDAPMMPALVSPLAPTSDLSLTAIIPVGALADDWFGHYVHSTEDRFIAGAPFDDHTHADQGTAYIYDWDGETWIETQQLTPSDASAAGERYGVQVRLDGTRAYVGADIMDGKGALYVYEESGSTYGSEVKLTASDGASGDQFGSRFAVSGDTLIISSFLDDDVKDKSGSVYVFNWNGTSWVESQKLNSWDIGSDAGDGPRFGTNIGFDGTTLAIGAFKADGNATDSGAVYVYKWDEATSEWVQDEKLVASDGATGDAFGHDIALEGGILAIGAMGDADAGSNTGAVYTFEKSGGAWTQMAKITLTGGAQDDYFGHGLGLESGVLSAGALGREVDGVNDAGAAYLFERQNATSWNLVSTVTRDIPAAGDRFGYVTSINEGIFFVGSPNHDSDKGAISWWRNGHLQIAGDQTAPANFASENTAGDGIHENAAVYGNHAFLSAGYDDDQGNNAGAVYVFSNAGGSWVQTQKLYSPTPESGGFFGGEIKKLAADDGYLAVGAHWEDVGANVDEGKAHLFRWDGSSWVFDSTITSPTGVPGLQFGRMLDLDGDLLVITAHVEDVNPPNYNEGAVHVYERDKNGVWQHQARLSASDSKTGLLFGSSVAVDADAGLIVAAAPTWDAPWTGNNQGAVYVFERNADGTWPTTETQRLTASTPGTDDYFGDDVAVSGNHFVASTAFDDDLGNNSGAAYLFHKTASGWEEQTKITPSDGAAGDWFGRTADIQDVLLIVGAPTHDDGGVSNTGKTYVYQLMSGNWTEVAQLTEQNSVEGNAFGGAVAINDGRAVIAIAKADDGANLDVGGYAVVDLRNNVAPFQPEIPGGPIAEAGNIQFLHTDHLGSPVAASIHAAPFTSVDINFQPAAAPVPAGFEVDAGSVYGDRGNGYTYGWDVDLTSRARDRNNPASPDQQHDTLNHSDYPGTPGQWEIEVPDGYYKVRIVAGDPSHTNSVYLFDVEGVIMADGTPTTQEPWVEGTGTVLVTDGRLTVSNAAGSSNNKIAFIEIDPATVVGTQSFYPFGEVRSSTGVFDTERGFTGQISDVATGLNFYNARYQDPVLGRFISPDSIVPRANDPGLFNRFAYVNNSPLSFTDPSGHCTKEAKSVARIVALICGEARRIQEETKETAKATMALASDVTDMVFTGLAAAGHAVGERHREWIEPAGLSLAFSDWSDDDRIAGIMEFADKNRPESGASIIIDPAIKLNVLGSAGGATKGDFVGVDSDGFVIVGAITFSSTSDGASGLYDIVQLQGGIKTINKDGSVLDLDLSPGPYRQQEVGNVFNGGFIYRDGLTDFGFAFLTEVRILGQLGEN